MKKFIFMFFLLFSILGFSDTVLDKLSGIRWVCHNLNDAQLINLFISKSTPDKYSATFNSFNNITKNGPDEVELGEFSLAINEKEQYFYFTNLNKKSQKFSSYRFNYKIGKKNKVKFSLYDTSKNKNICEFYSA